MQTELQRKLHKTIKTSNLNHTYSNGDTFQGRIYDYKRNGEGLLTLSDGSYYKGIFKNGELQGEGEFFLSFTNLKFKGNFEKGKKQGKGILVKDGYKFEGEFQQDFKHGPFVEYFERKNIKREGIYQNGQLHGKVIEINTETQQKIFEGYIENGQKQKECYYDCEEYIYQGNYLNDKFEGQGKILMKIDQIVYEGEFCNGLPKQFANDFLVKIYQLKINKEGQEEKLDITKNDQAIKLESNQNYILEIKVVFQGEQFKNPEYEELEKQGKKIPNKIPEFLQPEPIDFEQENNRILKKRRIE